MQSGLARTVEEIILDWRPDSSNDREHDYQVDLEQFLRDELNRGNVEPIVIDRNCGPINADIVVDEWIGIELKNDLSKRQSKELGDEIEEYTAHYDHVFVVACGVDDTAGWDRHIRDYETDGGTFGLGGIPVAFIEK